MHYKCLKFLLVTFCTPFISACNLFYNNEDIELDDVIAVVNINNNIADKKHRYNDINTSNVECLRDLSYLQKIGSRYYSNLSKNYADIANAFRFYDESQYVMADDTQDIYTMKLIIKRDALCAKIKHNVATEIKDKIS